MSCEAVPDTETRIRAAGDDVLVPYSTVFLASLQDVDGALALPHAPGNQILRTLDLIQKLRAS